MAHLNPESFLYPDIDPFNQDWLEVSSIHKIYYEQVGNPDGKPVLIVHGGPGGAKQDHYRRYFDPSFYHIILFDQRGCGKSTPKYCIEENTTEELIKDIEKLRKHIRVESFFIFGHSWGSLLSMLYTHIGHIGNVKGLVLHGFFTSTQSEIDWMYKKGGASKLLPDFFKEFETPIPVAERGDLLMAYYERIKGECQTVAEQCTRTFNMYNKACTRPINSEETRLEIVKMTNQNVKVNPNGKRIYFHYLTNLCFLKENVILKNLEIVKESGIPVTFIHGRMDILVSAEKAFEFHELLPNSDFVWVENGSHAHYKIEGEDQLATMKTFVQVFDRYRNVL